MNLEFIQLYTNIKNTIREEQSFYYGFFFIFCIGYYIIHNLFTLYNLPRDANYFGTLFIFFILSFLIWYIKYQFVKYRKESINILFFPFENSITSQSHDKKFEMNNEIIKIFYNALELLEYSNNKKKVNIIKMTYKYNNLSDTELLSKFDKSSADILIRGKLINNGDLIGVIPLFLFTNNFKKKCEATKKYLITNWNLISILNLLEVVCIDSSHVQTSKKSLNTFNSYISNMFVLIISLVSYYSGLLKSNKTLLRNFILFCDSSRGKYGEIFDIYLNTIMINVATSLNYDRQKIIKIYKAQISLVSKNDDVLLQSQYYFSIYHGYGDLLLSMNELKESEKCFLISFQYKPNRHALRGLVSIYKKNGNIFSKKDEILNLCDDFVEYCGENRIFSFFGYKIKGELLIDFFSESEDDKNKGLHNLEMSLKILKNEWNRKNIRKFSFLEKEINEIENILINHRK